MSIQRAIEKIDAGEQSISSNYMMNTGLSDAALWSEVREWLESVGDERTAPHMLAEALARIERVEALASGWEARGEYDMEFSKTLPDEDIAMEILTNGAQMVENARHIRNAIGATK